MFSNISMHILILFTTYLSTCLDVIACLKAYFTIFKCVKRRALFVTDNNFFVIIYYPLNVTTLQFSIIRLSATGHERAIIIIYDYPGAQVRCCDKKHM